MFTESLFIRNNQIVVGRKLPITNKLETKSETAKISIIGDC